MWIIVHNKYGKRIAVQTQNITMVEEDDRDTVIRCNGGTGITYVYTKETFDEIGQMIRE